MAQKLIENVQGVILNTGNILSLNDITKKPGQSPSEELVEVINITLNGYQNGDNQGIIKENEHMIINRRLEDLQNKLAEHELGELKIGLKIFLNSDVNAFLIEALEKAFVTLNIASVHNVIIAYNQKTKENQAIVEEIKNIWKTLEKYAQEKKIIQIGLADVEESTFRTIYDWASIKPSIIQINLASCCVVPPTLQAFCKEKEVQLLTHSDPTEILPDDSIENIFGKRLHLNWALRFLVHIKCRGVLTTKGYLISLNCK